MSQSRIGRAQGGGVRGNGRERTQMVGTGPRGLLRTARKPVQNRRRLGNGGLSPELLLG